MGSEEKLFTQAEVEDILRKRLARSKIDDEELQKRNTALEERESQLETLQKEMAQREAVIDCKAYLQESGYPLDLIDVLDTSDVELFKSKADKAFEIGKTTNNTIAPLFNAEAPSKNDDIAARVFSPDFRHKPKEKY